MSESLKLAVDSHHGSENGGETVSDATHGMSPNHWPCAAMKKKQIKKRVFIFWHFQIITTSFVVH